MLFVTIYWHWIGIENVLCRYLSYEKSISTEQFWNNTNLLIYCFKCNLFSATFFQGFVDFILILYLLFQFQKTYPDIYSKRFPTSESEAELFPNKPKIKQPLLARPLLRFRNIRLWSTYNRTMSHIQGKSIFKLTLSF